MVASELAHLSVRKAADLLGLELVELPVGRADHRAHQREEEAAAKKRQDDEAAAKKRQDDEAAARKRQDDEVAALAAKKLQEETEAKARKRHLTKALKQCRKVKAGPRHARCVKRANRKFGAPEAPLIGLPAR